MISNIPIKSEKEIEIMRQGGKILARILKEIMTKIRPDITTGEIENFARTLFKNYKLEPSFLGYKGYPACSCISINEEWVHGIPSERKIKKGDIVSLDVGVYYKGYATDMAITFGIGGISKEDQNLIKATKKALDAGIKKARAGNRIGDISAAIQQVIEEGGFSVMRKYRGHGVGKEPHEEPDIPDFGSPNTGPKIKKGMIFALEPMASAGDYRTKVLSNGWTVIPKDGSRTAHFEHTVAITDKGPEILTR